MQQWQECIQDLLRPDVKLESVVSQDGDIRLVMRLENGALAEHTMTAREVEHVQRIKRLSDAITL